MNYRNINMPIEIRLRDLLSRMSLKQKIDQITCLVTITEDIPDFKDYIPNGIGNVGAFTIAENVDLIADYVYELQKFLMESTELGIPALIHCEACAGAQFTSADVFPSAIGQASTFNAPLIGQMADIIREQMHAIGFRQALSPVFDIARDPRWGRISETYGEDPALAAAFGTYFTKGLQTSNLKNGILATGKHFVGHGVTEGGLNMGRNLVTERDLYEVHAKPFQAAISKAALASVMNSYCSINGEPIVGSKKLLTGLLRNDMQFKGFVVSDYIAIDRLVDPFNVAAKYTDAGERALKAGVDIEYPRPKGFTYNLEEAVEHGRIDISVIDQAVSRVLRYKFELGLFEDPYPNRKRLYQSLGLSETRDLNEKMACESLILLKNENNILPLSKNVKKIAVVGPHADSVRSYFGTFSYPAVLDMTMSREEDGQTFKEPGLIVYDIEQQYSGDIRESSPRVEKKIRDSYPHIKSLYHALEEFLPDSDVSYSRGINFAGTNIGGFDAAVEAAAQADVVLLTLGGKNGWGVTSTVGEGVDSTDIDLPGKQEDFAKAIRNLNKKTVVLHFDGRPLSNSYVATHFDAILEVWQPGIMGGQALCKTIFGENNPAGRLPVTAAKSVGQLPVYYNMPRGSGFIGAGHAGMIRNPRGYINDTAAPLFHFGHGLSYTEFEYESIDIDKDIIKADESVAISVRIKNVGCFDGDEVVQLYFSDEISSMVRPELELAGFCRVNIPKGESAEIKFVLHSSQLSFLDEEMKWKIEAGSFSLMVGASSCDIRLEKKLKIEDSKEIDPINREFYIIGELVK